MTHGWAIATCAATLGVGLSALFLSLPELIWNASASVPIGLYAVRPPGSLEVAELVAVMPPATLASFLDERHYLPRLAHAQSRPRASGPNCLPRRSPITVDRIAMGDALDRDSAGRPLPAWQGCRHIPDGDVFLVNWQSEDSLDGRYFGLLPVTTVVGRPIPSGRARRTDRAQPPPINSAPRAAP